MSGPLVRAYAFWRPLVFSSRFLPWARFGVVSYRLGWTGLVWGLPVNRGNPSYQAGHPIVTTRGTDDAYTHGMNLKPSETVWMVAIATPVVLGVGPVVAAVCGRYDIVAPLGCLAGMAIPTGFSLALWASDLLARRGL